MDSPAAARVLWTTSGLQEIFGGVTVGGLHPVGLNSNLRMYR